MFNITIGLICVMIANILFGASLAKLQKKFNVKKLLSGGFKLFCIVGGAGLMYICSFLNPDMMILNIGNTNMNLIEGMKAVFMAGIVFYGYQDIIKLKDILKINIEISEPTKESTVEVKQDNVLDRGEE